MREIKFRAWDKNRKIMVEVIAMEIRFPKYFVNDGKNISYWLEPKEIELMQYTSLKDKNGKEIYEGDIVKKVDGLRFLFSLDWKIDKGSIEWMNEEGGWIVSDKNDNHYVRICSDESGDDDDIGEKQVEVIGNIYENPEPEEPKK